tara:strand:- start:432 stop:803 length:372 start_codon:yes stop_codon:yes gene_type:complete
MALKKLKELFWYSDSEPNEVLIAFCHIFALPATLCVDFDNPSIILISAGVLAGSFQLWAVLWNGGLKMRLYAVQIAALIAIATVENLIAANLMSGSRVGWGIICAFAIWNTVRVFKEKIQRGL